MQVAAIVSDATLFVDSRFCRRPVDLAADRTRAPRPAYPRLRLWACDNESVLDAILPGTRPPVAAFVPGSPCPLCGFPVTRVETGWDSQERRTLAALIAGDFSSWRPESGAYERCVEGYAVRAGQWL